MQVNIQANRVFKEVDESRKRYIVLKGSAGSGKSVDTAQNYILRLMKDPGRNLLCVRKSDVTNRDSTFAELQSTIFRMFGDHYKKYWYINSSNMILECKSNHNQIIFRGVNDEKQREKLKSITFKRGKLTDVWIEEATEITQSDFEIIDDRLRGILPKGLFYQIRDNRIINFDGDTERMLVDFLQKPDGDTTQEHLIERLEKLIFQISMVANISDESFGTSSGIAMKYKLQGMSNLEKTKERKFTSGMNRRYRLIFSNPVSGMKKDDWVKIHPHFTPNFPANLQEEAEIAKNLEGVVSQETQLGVLSIVDNVQDEIDKMESEQEKLIVDPVVTKMFDGGSDGDVIGTEQ